MGSLVQVAHTSAFYLRTMPTGFAEPMEKVLSYSIIL